MALFNSYDENTLMYFTEKCIGCKMCWTVCPHGVFVENGRKAELARYKACMECGACVKNCPTDAIMVQSGVGCAAAMIQAALTGRKEACCG